MQGEADRDGVDGSGTLQALGGSGRGAALREGRRWEDVQSGSNSVCMGECAELGNAPSL